MKQKRLLLTLALTRKKYERPTMKVVELQHRKRLLAGSSVNSSASINNWQDGGTDTEDIYM